MAGSNIVLKNMVLKIKDCFKGNHKRVNTEMGKKRVHPNRWGLAGARHLLCCDALAGRVCSGASRVSHLPRSGAGGNRRIWGRCIRIFRTRGSAADRLFFANAEGFENWLRYSLDAALALTCKRRLSALPFNLFVRSTIQIPANSQTQNLG